MASKASGWEHIWWRQGVSSILSQHVFAALLLSFVVLPAASSKIFRMLTPCLEELPDGTRLHRADLAVDCASNSYKRAYATAIVMIFVYPLGIPAAYFAILLYYREKINPPGLERLSALQLRGADLTLRPISFLYATYTPEAYMFEIFDSYRRIVMQGVLTFASLEGWETGETRLSHTARL